MATKPNPASLLSAQNAESPDVADFFHDLAAREITLARLQDELSEEIVRCREVCDGRPFQFNRDQTSELADFDKGAIKATQELERLIPLMDDANLLISALCDAWLWLETDERMLSAWHPDAQPKATTIIEFRKETIDFIEDFITNSPLRDAILASPLVRINPKPFRRLVSDAAD